MVIYSLNIPGFSYSLSCGRQETPTPHKRTELSHQEFTVIYEAFPHTVREVINTYFQER